MQLVPTLAPQVKQLDVYQRTPIWILPKRDYVVPSVIQTLFSKVKGLQSAARMMASAATELVMVMGIVYNKQFPGLAKKAQAICLNNLNQQVKDPALRKKLTPDYGFGCKRPSFSNEYFKSFTRDDVDLITSPIKKITKNSIITNDGIEREIDTLILATGFSVFEKGNLPTYKIYGIDGQEIDEFWEQNRYQAYEGATIPGFPNYFAILGPYSISGASWFSMVEAQTRHALRCINHARKKDATYVEVTRQANDKYFNDVLERQKNTIFFNNACGTSNSYYFNKHGDAPFLRPSSGLEMWFRSHTFPLRDYIFK